MRVHRGYCVPAPRISLMFPHTPYPFPWLCPASHGLCYPFPFIHSSPGHSPCSFFAVHALYKFIPCAFHLPSSCSCLCTFPWPYLFAFAHYHTLYSPPSPLSIILAASVPWQRFLLLENCSNAHRYRARGAAQFKVYMPCGLCHGCAGHTLRMRDIGNSRSRSAGGEKRSTK